MSTGEGSAALEATAFVFGSLQLAPNLKCRRVHSRKKRYTKRTTLVLGVITRYWRHETSSRCDNPAVRVDFGFRCFLL